MSTLFKILAAIAAGFAAVALVVAGVALRELSSTRDQLTTVSRELHSTRTELGTVSAAANGSHRDLITCADLQTTDQYIDGIVSPQGDIGPVEFSGPGDNLVSSLPLPSHCING